MLSKFK